MFQGSLKKVLAEKYGKAYAARIMKKSKKVYRELVEKADDIGDDNPMAYNELFALAFVAPYVATEKKIPPETVQEMMRQSGTTAITISQEIKSPFERRKQKRYEA